ESSKFHNSRLTNKSFSVTLLSVKYWYIVPVQYIPLPLDGEHQILLFNWLEYYTTIHTTWLIPTPLSFILNAIWIDDGSKSFKIAFRPFSFIFDSRIIGKGSNSI